MIPEIEIRRAEAADATGIAIVQAYTWLTAYRGLMPDEVLKARLAKVPAQAGYYREQLRQGGRYLAAVSGGAVIGFAAYGPSRDRNFPEDGEVAALYVLESFHGMGAGKALFVRCAEELREEGFGQMIVNCLEGNPSMGFYERMGGRAVGEREDMLHGGHVIREKILRFEL